MVREEHRDGRPPSKDMKGDTTSAGNGRELYDR